MDPKIFSYIPTGTPARADGPLTGKTFALQPNMSVRGWPTDAGSKALAGFVALETATAVERILAGGGLLAGSTLMPEFGLGLSPETTAEAVQGRHCDVALVTDLMGESGLIAGRADALGFKPSYGVVPRSGLIGLVPSMESFALVAPSLPDISSTLAVMAGPDGRDNCMVEEGGPDFSPSPRPAGQVEKIGFISESLSALAPEETEAFTKAMKRLEGLGIKIVDLSFPDYPLFRLAHHAVAATEASSAAGKFDGVRYGHRATESDNWNEMYLRSRAECFGTLVKSFLFQGAYFQFERFSSFNNAARIRRRLVEGIKTLLGQVDLIASFGPRAGSGGPPSIQKLYDAFACTLSANVTGQPTLSLPASWFGEAVPVSLQFSGGHLDDVKLLNFASRLAAGK